MSIREELVEMAGEDAPLIFLEPSEDFDSCIVGLSERINLPMAVTYDMDKILAMLVHKHDMPYEEALEHFEFNIAGGYLGERSPVFILAPKGTRK